MSFAGYLKDRARSILLNIACACAVAIFAFGIGLAASEIFLLILFWLAIMLLYFGIGYVLLRRKWKELMGLSEALEKAYLISEIMEKPKTMEDKLYYGLMKRASKSMIEEVSRLNREQTEYKEYIEQWIHEVKVPITAVKLICENNKDDTAKRILSQMERIDNEVERALYYARAGYVEKDYIISETNLEDVVSDVLANNKQILMQNAVSVDVQNLNAMVYSDAKWLKFILNQLISNSLKYKSDAPLRLTFSAEAIKHGICLSVADNGVGVPESEIDRIFDKGFTGTSGRKNAKSTGMGLYLSKKLCGKLGLQIQAELAEEGLCIRILFPKGTLQKFE